MTFEAAIEAAGAELVAMAGSALPVVAVVAIAWYAVHLLRQLITGELNGPIDWSESWNNRQREDR